jgi:hypothetical protein
MFVNFAVEGSYTNYSSDEITSSMSAANGTALEAAIVALPEAFNCVFILLPLYYYIIFKKTSR